MALLTSNWGSRHDGPIGYLTKFEEAAIIGHRAHELAIGKTEVSKSDPLHPTPVKDDIELAERELIEGRIDMTIRRYYPDKTYTDHEVSSLKVRPR
jgi:DNA-directed RNA polymerase subunit K/omega